MCKGLVPVNMHMESGFNAKPVTSLGNEKMTDHEDVNLGTDVKQASGVSRRKVLQGAAIAAGGVAMLVAAAVPAEAKMAQAAAGYQDTPKNGAACSTCALFKAPSSCTLVDGTISPNGWCRFYAKKTS